MDLNERGRRALARFRASRGKPQPFLDRRTLTLAVALALGIVALAVVLQRVGFGGAFGTLFRGGSADLEGFEVFLHRQGCPGPCPVYAVLVKADADGRVFVEYEGVEFVATDGSQRAEVDALALQALWRAAERAGFADAPPAMKPGVAGCGQWRNGLELIRIGVTRAGATRTVELYPGCEPGDPKLVQFAREIDALAGSARWINPGAQP